MQHSDGSHINTQKYVKENPFQLYHVIQLSRLVSNSRMQKGSQTSFLSIQYSMLCAKFRILRWLLSQHSNLSLFFPLLPFYLNLFCNFYYPAHQPSISLLPSPCLAFFLSFLSPGTMQVGRILLLLFQLHLVVLCFSLFLFPAQFICFVIQLLSASHVLLLLLVPDHLFICHQVQHVLLTEHLQLLDSFSSKNAGCYQH